MSITKGGALSIMPQPASILIQLAQYKYFQIKYDLFRSSVKS